MGRMQFTLRHLLIAIVLIAVGLLLIRFAIQSHGVAVASLVVAIGATILLIANVAIYGMLRGFGMIFGLEVQRVQESEQPTEHVSPQAEVPDER